MANPALRKVSLEQALLDPASVFERPDDVVGHPGLAPKHKIEILRRWAYDATEIAVAEEEGMSGDEVVAIGLIVTALHRLTDGDANERSAPTKHAGRCEAMKKKPH
jgi:hypothetical protein